MSGGNSNAPYIIDGGLSYGLQRPKVHPVVCPPNPFLEVQTGRTLNAKEVFIQRFVDLRNANSDFRFVKYPNMEMVKVLNLIIITITESN